MMGKGMNKLVAALLLCTIATTVSANVQERSTHGGWKSGNKHSHVVNIQPRDAASQAALIQSSIQKLILAISYSVLRVAVTAACKSPSRVFILTGGQPTCLNIASDSSNCGSVGFTCASLQVCMNSLCTTPPAGRFDFTNNKVRGVNLGGWLVLEAWITPSIFAATNNPLIVDEWTLTQYLGSAKALSILTPHWQTWFTESDIIAIGAAGLNTVRIPIGYWAFDIVAPEQYVGGQLPYLLQAITWCAKHNLKVMVDIHGLPGSQNGFDNSGRRGVIGWFTSSIYVSRSAAIISTLSNLLNQPQYQATVTSIEVVNEPAGFFSPQLVSVYQMYLKAVYNYIRNPSTGPSPIGLSFSDAFQPFSSWAGFFPSPTYTNVQLDAHIYAVFSNYEIGYTPAQRIASICARGPALATSNSNYYTTYVGEWSTAPTDCAPNLNSRGFGSRFDGTYPGSTAIGSCAGKSGLGSTFSADYKILLRKMFEVQTSVYENHSSGWVSWTWKAEAADDWSYSAGIAGGWIPKNPSEKLFGNQCLV